MTEPDPFAEIDAQQSATGGHRFVTERDWHKLLQAARAKDRCMAAEKTTWKTPSVIAALCFAVASTAAVFGAYASMQTRVSVIETVIPEIRADVKEIKGTLARLERKP